MSNLLKRLITTAAFAFALVAGTIALPASAQQCPYNSTQASCACPSAGNGVDCTPVSKRFRATDNSCQTDPRPPSCPSTTQVFDCSSLTCTCPGGTQWCGASSTCVAVLACPAGTTFDPCTNSCSSPNILKDQASAQSAFINVTGDIKSSAGDYYIANGKSIRSDLASAVSTIYVGNYGASSGGVILNLQNGILQLGQRLGAPAAAATGMMYYDAGLAKFRCNVSNVWVDCASGGGGSSQWSNVAAPVGITYGGGNVGIGINPANFPLHVNGNVGLEGASKLILGGNGSGESIWSSRSGSYPIVFTSGGVDRMWLNNDGSLALAGKFTADSSGNPGVGVCTGDDACFWDVNAANVNGIYGQQNNAEGGLRFGSNGPTVYGQNGNLGIGLTTPGATLHVKKDNGAGTTGILAENQNVSTSGAAAFVMKTGASGNMWQMFTRNNKLFWGVAGVADYMDLGQNGDLRVNGAMRPNANAAPYLCGGDDACLWDINAQNYVAIRGTANGNEGGLQLGAGGVNLYGQTGWLNVGGVINTQVNGGSYRQQGKELISYNWDGTQTVSWGYEGAANYFAHNTGIGTGVNAAYGLSVHGVQGIHADSDSGNGVAILAGSGVGVNGSGSTAGVYASSDVGDAVQGIGGDAGGYFQDSNNSGYGWVGYGDEGVLAKGNSDGGHFMNTSKYSEVYAGATGNAIDARGYFPGGYVGFFYNTDTGASSSGISVQIGPGTGAKLGNQFMKFTNANGTVQGTVTGNAGGNGVQYNTTSDARRKENVTPYDGATGLLERMAVKRYNFIGNDVPEIGFLAQELYQVYPDVVRVGGADPMKDPWSVDYGRMTPVIIRGFQEQQTTIEAQQQKIDDLEARLEKLEAKLK
ncbi:MAG: hypothetical protein RLZZ324_1222 [Candidatus Parcubacteria bacterium]|jgi:hypothetical protein